jgi:hypothetical protein
LRAGRTLQSTNISRTKLTIAIDNNRHRIVKGDSGDTGNKSCGLSSVCSDTNGVSLSGNAWITDVDVVIAGGKICACRESDANVFAARGIAQESALTNGSIFRSQGIKVEREYAHSRIVGAVSIPTEGFRPGSGIIKARYITVQGRHARGGVFISGGVLVQCPETSRRIVIRCVVVECFRAGRRVIRPSAVVEK